MLNPAMQGLVKVGKTSGTSEGRARRLRSTGVPARFVVLYDIHVDDTEAVETATHEALKAYRYEPDREFFNCSPKEAINTLLEIAAPRAAPRETSESEVDIFQRLLERFGPIFHPDLTRVAVHVTEGGVLLRSTRRSAHNETITIETNLDVIGLEDGPLCTPEASASENADRLLSVDELTLVMCTPLVRAEEAERIDKEQNPYWTGLWLSRNE